ncbi:MAG: protein serine/threonine phosphatase [Frankiales bacterium]|nr:protein serine/threonine phosphatase [Frankiales bacterium]
MTLTLKYATRSDVGLIRTGNEDAFYAGPRLLAVADGMGGHAAGEVASSVVIGTLSSLDEDTPSRDLLDVLQGAVATANDHLRQMVAADNELEGMGTTLTAMLWSGRRLALAHVGDSRAYLFRDGELHQLTKDHTLVQSLVDEGRLSADDAGHHPQRSMLMRALDGRVDVEPDISVREAQFGDRYLLCSDGLSGVVSDETIAHTLVGKDPQEAVDALVDLALRGGGPDNITCIVADVVDAGASGTPVVGGAAAEPEPTSPNPATSAGRAALADGRRVAVTESPSTGLTDFARAMTPPPAFRWLKILAALVVLVAIVVGAYVGIRAYVRSQWYVGDDGGYVAVFRGVPGAIAGVHFHDVASRTDIAVAALPDLEKGKVEQGVSAPDQAAAQQVAESLRAKTLPTPPATQTPSPSPTVTPAPSPSKTPSRSATKAAG